MKKQDSLGILERVQADDKLREAWENLSEPAREMFRDVDEKKRVPDILNDAMFKGVFDPKVRPKWLSKLISSVIGREVRVIAPLVKEGRKHSVKSKGVIMDIPVEFQPMYQRAINMLADRKELLHMFQMPKHAGEMSGGHFYRSILK